MNVSALSNRLISTVPDVAEKFFTMTLTPGNSANTVTGVMSPVIRKAVCVNLSRFIGDFS